MGKRMMGASHEKKDGLLTPGFLLNRDEAELICLLFEEQVNHDIEEYEIEQKQIKLLKRICLLKTICYPIEIVVTLLVLGKIAVKERNQSQGYYWGFLRKKINYDQLINNLNRLSSNSRME